MNKMGFGSAINFSLRKGHDKIPLYRRLRTRLLLLIALCVFVTEILVFLPSIANMRQDWLVERHHAAQAISLVLLNMNKENIQQESLAQKNKILQRLDALAINVITNGHRQSLARQGNFYNSQENSDSVGEVIDLDSLSEIKAIFAAFTTLFSHNNGIIMVRGSVLDGDMILELVVPKRNLHLAMVEFSINFLIGSFFIAIIAATLIYFIIYELLVCPLQNIYVNLLGFVMEPDNPSRILSPEQRKDEVGATQRRVAAVESALQKNYVRQKHLANLGLAISKINHDMRNVLASAQLMSDHLSQATDPMVRKLAPKLIKAIDRAVAYSQSVITYGNSQETPPKREHLNLRQFIDEVHDNLIVCHADQVQFENLVPENIAIDADREHLHRVMSNLCRNSIQAMTEGADAEDCIFKRLTIRAGRIGTSTIIDLEDTGPGLPLKARENLFVPFQGSTSRNGTGLGLAICDELIRAHGGTIKLLEDGKSGAHFEIRIPDAPASLNDWRKKQQVLSA